jgi:hypothetical protein
MTIDSVLYRLNSYDYLTEYQLDKRRKTQTYWREYMSVLFIIHLKNIEHIQKLYKRLVFM